MKKYFFICFVSLFLFSLGSAQDTTTVQPADALMSTSNGSYKPNKENREEVYKIKKSVDIPVLAIGAGWCGYAFTKIYNKDRSTVAQVENLSRNDVSSFNRSAIDHYSLKAQHTGDLFFYGSMPLPLLLFLDKEIRKDAGRVGILFFETMAVTGTLYTSAVYFHDKYRPYVYNPAVPMSERTRGGGKNSFFAGHVALVGSGTFFIAKVYSDYHPHSGVNWLLYTLAAGATATTAWCRYDGGQHFPSDILIGAAEGTLAGILIPHFHKNKPLKSTGFHLMPYMGEGYGLAAVYKF